MDKKIRVEKDIDPRNNKGRSNGYQELYFTNYHISIRGNCKNGLLIGYNEDYWNHSLNFNIR